MFDATRSTTEALAREISLCMRYYSVTFRGHRPGKLRLVGGESADPQIQSTLAAALPIPVEASSPLYSVETGRMKPSDRRGHLGEWATALGLGLSMTRTYFGARDGKRRQIPAPAATAQASAVAEVVDLASAIQAPAMTSTPTRTASGEAVHA